MCLPFLCLPAHPSTYYLRIRPSICIFKRVMLKNSKKKNYFFSFLTKIVDTKVIVSLGLRITGTIAEEHRKVIFPVFRVYHMPRKHWAGWVHLVVDFFAQSSIISHLIEATNCLNFNLTFVALLISRHRWIRRKREKKKRWSDSV